MHEFSLAQGLHWQLLDLARDHHAQRITRAEILIGSNAGIVEESFLFGVNVLIGQDPRTEGMEVIILRDDGRDLMLMQVELDSGGASSD